MKITTLRTILFLTIILLTTKISAQDHLITVRVIDNLTRKPVKDAEIYTGDSIVSTTNYSGYSRANAISGDTILISCNDYLEKFIIVPKAQKFQVGLDKKEDKLIFTGGVQFFYDHWGANLKYPSKARSKKIQAVIYVEFKVDSIGNSTLVKIHNDKYNLFEPEINRVFKSLTGKWSIDYSERTFLFPIEFRLQSLQPPKDIELSGVNPDRRLSEIVVTAYQ